MPNVGKNYVALAASVGITAEFAVAAIRTALARKARERYPQARALTITDRGSL